jgi:uncharacterized protein YqhQ
MMRGRRYITIAVREPTGKILLRCEQLNPRIYAGFVSKLPLLRALIMLWDTLVLGIRSLLFSAEVAMGEEEVDFTKPMAWGTIAFSLAIAIALFFVAPLLLVRIVESYIASFLTISTFELIRCTLEGLIRLAFLLTYIYVIGFVPEIERIFAYHGAEHKTINAYEDGAELTPSVVREYSTAHPRCGTSFVLMVVVISILTFALLGKQPLVWRILSRIFLIPFIAAVSYELVRFSASHQDNPILRSVVLSPSLALQRLTTRQPDDSMLEVAITSLKRLLSMEEASHNV